MRTIAAYAAVTLALAALARYWVGMGAVQIVIVFAMAGAFMVALRVLDRRALAAAPGEPGEDEPVSTSTAPAVGAMVETRPWPRSVWARQGDKVGTDPTR